jgi:hypothetical protein
MTATRTDSIAFAHQIQFYRYTFNETADNETTLNTRLALIEQRANEMHAASQLEGGFVRHTLYWHVIHCTNLDISSPTSSRVPALQKILRSLWHICKA